MVFGWFNYTDEDGILLPVYSDNWNQNKIDKFYDDKWNKQCKDISDSLDITKRKCVSCESLINHYANWNKRCFTCYYENIPYNNPLGCYHSDR